MLLGSSRGRRPLAALTSPSNEILKRRLGLVDDGRVSSHTHSPSNGHPSAMATTEAIEMQKQARDTTTDIEKSAMNKGIETEDALGPRTAPQATGEKVHASSAAPDIAAEGPTTQEDPEQTRLLLRKLDYQVLPVALILYATSFVDRSAIGYARAAGLMKDLKLTDGKYAFATSIFFVCYAIFGECDSRHAPKIWPKI